MNWERIGLTLGIGLFMMVFGISYNRWVADQEQSGSAEGFTSLFVAFGVFITLLAQGGLQMVWPETNCFWLGLYAFGCSGIPMIVGSISRFNQLREQARAARREMDRHG